MILTIDEAIRHCEEVAEENEKEFRLCPYPSQECSGSQDCRCLENGESKGCLKCAAEHKQLVDWLKELKELRELKLCKDAVSRKAAIDAMCSACGNDCDKSEFVYNAPRWEQVILCPEHYALTVLPSVQPESCGDAVNRNAIIRALNTMDRYVSDELTLCNTDRKFPKNEVFIVDDVYEEIVERLPSAQPDPCGGEQ